MCDDNILTLMKDCPFSENITNISLIYVITLTLEIKKNDVVDITSTLLSDDVK